MKFYFPTVLTYIIGSHILLNCSSAPPVQKKKELILPEIDVIQVKENSDEALRLSRETKLDMDAINTKLVEIDNKLLIIGEELATFSAAKLEELENRVALLSEEIRLLNQQLHASKTPGRKASPQEQFLKKGTFTPNPKPVRNKPKMDETEAQLYKRASDLFYARKYSQAISQYNKLINKYPKGTYADNAVFWKAECHFAVSNYAKAITVYQRVFSYARSEKADDAQFKLAICHLKMGDKNQAVTEFEKLLSLYPDSEFVSRTKQELKKLK